MSASSSEGAEPDLTPLPERLNLDQCIGELVGHENEGIKAMFAMMNSARINVGNQGVQIAERALQQAQRYALDRIQSARAGSPSREPVAIVEMRLRRWCLRPGSCR